MEIYYIFKFNFIYQDWLTQKALDRVHICFMIDKYWYYIDSVPWSITYLLISLFILCQGLTFIDVIKLIYSFFKANIPTHNLFFLILKKKNLLNYAIFLKVYIICYLWIVCKFIIINFLNYIIDTSNQLVP